MIIDPQSAQAFIQGYSIILAEVHRLSNGETGLELLTLLAAGREVAITSPSILEFAIEELTKSGRPVSTEVICAVRSLQLRQWVYLRDTTAYSVFLDPSGKEAYAVLGLTNRIRDILGGSGAYLRTGIVEFRGRYVCDGIVSNTVWLGSNYRKEFSANLAELKKEGKFYVSPAS